MLSFSKKTTTPAPSLLEQIETFKSLGYTFIERITPEVIIKNAEQLHFGEDVMKYFMSPPYSLLYYYFGWQDSAGPYSNRTIWYDIEFIDQSSVYISFMKRMGAITRGELVFSDFHISCDDEGYEWLKFKVNSIAKSWKLEKPGYISDAFFKRFSSLNSEFNTSGSYTYYSDGGQQFVIDYVTAEEQVDFLKTTQLHREWLKDTSAFSNP